jgi:hypothetical protein
VRRQRQRRPPAADPGGPRRLLHQQHRDTRRADPLGSAARRGRGRRRHPGPGPRHRPAGRRRCAATQRRR